MSEENRDPATIEHEEFERQDLDAGGVLMFLAGLGVVCVLAYFIVLGMYRYLDAYNAKHQPPPQTTLVVPRPATRVVTNADTQSFPQPRLQKDDVQEMNDLRIHEIETLGTYGWVDAQAGQARIPIERAMELTAERGLPVRQQGAAKSIEVEAKKAGKN